MFVTINICLDKSIVATKIILVAVPAGDIKQFLLMKAYQHTIARVSGRVVVVRELFSRDVSDLCADQRSEVMKIVYHMTQVFRLLLRSHHSEFVGTI